MSWLKFDDKRAMHKKLRKAGFAARGLDEAAICQSGAEETDGFIDDVTLSLLGTAHGETPKTLAKLVAILCSPAVDRWSRDNRRGGYVIKDYLVYNATHAELEEKREKDRRRKRPEIQADSERIPDGITTDSESVPRTPSRPVPSRPNDSDADASSSSSDDDDPVFTEALKQWADRKMIGQSVLNRPAYRAKVMSEDRVEFGPLRAAHLDLDLDALLVAFEKGPEDFAAHANAEMRAAETRRRIILGEIQWLRDRNQDGGNDAEIAELEAEFVSLREAAGIVELAS